MADKTYKLNITKSDGSFSDSVQFTIPQREGIYKVEFELSNGNKVNAGNINVSNVAKTYKAEFKLSDGSTIDGGTFSTPVVAGWKTVWTGNQTVASFSYKSEQEGTKTVTLTNTTLAGVDWSRPTKITGVATAQSGGIFGESNTKDLSSLELIDGESVHLVSKSDLHKGSIDMSIIRNASVPEVVVSATCERLVTGAGMYVANLVITKVEQYY